jgi:aspartyl-tRNA(Asn)/glutamyl-tRNA(Gln) amidotransferase subunit C
MAEDIKLIETLETLAHIELTKDERRLLAPQLDAILDYVRRLQRVNVAGIEAASAVKPVSAERLERDEPAGGLVRESALEGAPDTEDGLFRVPRVIKR